MCLDPTGLSYVALAIGAVSSIATYQVQSENASKQTEAIQTSENLKQNDLDRQQAQLVQQQAAEANALAMRQREDMAAFDVIAGENGGGVSAQRGLASLGIQQGQDTATLKDNGLKQSTEIGYGKAAASTSARSSLSTIAQPSATQLGLGLANAGITYGNTQNRIKRQSTYPSANQYD